MEKKELWSMTFCQGEEYKQYYVLADNFSAAEEGARKELAIFSEQWKLDSAHLMSSDALVLV